MNEEETTGSQNANEPVITTASSPEDEPKDLMIEQEGDGLYYLVHIHNPKNCTINIKQSGNPPPPLPPYGP